MRTIATSWSLLIVTAICYSQATQNNVSSWRYPVDRDAIRSQTTAKPYQANGLPRGTLAIQTKYIEPGFRVATPSGGFWEFEGVAKLSYKGRMFAIVGAPQLVSDGTTGGYLGAVTAIVIYDEDGDGFFETVEDLNDKPNKQYAFHVPQWVDR